MSIFFDQHVRREKASSAFANGKYIVQQDWSDKSHGFNIILLSNLGKVANLNPKLGNFKNPTAVELPGDKILASYEAWNQLKNKFEVHLSLYDLKTNEFIKSGTVSDNSGKHEQLNPIINLLGSEKILLTWQENNFQTNSYDINAKVYNLADFTSENTESLVTEGKRTVNYKVQGFENGEFAVAWQQWDYNLNKNKIGIKVFNQKLDLIKYYHINPDNISTENPAMYSHQDQYHVAWKSFINCVKREIFTSDFNLNELSSSLLNVSGEDFITADPLVTSFNNYIIYAYRAWNPSNSAYDVVFKIKDPESEKNFSKAYKISGGKAGFDRIEFIKNGNQLSIKAEHGSLTEIIDISEFIVLFNNSQLTKQPSESPTELPTILPTASPTAAPTIKPTILPTASPTVAPTIKPTILPTVSPTGSPTAAPTGSPSELLTISPSWSPTMSSTIVSSTALTLIPNYLRTASPSELPTISPSKTPTTSPTTKLPNGQIIYVKLNTNGTVTLEQGNNAINRDSADHAGTFRVIVSKDSTVSIKSGTEGLGNVIIGTDEQAKEISKIQIEVKKSEVINTNLYPSNSLALNSIAKFFYASSIYNIPKVFNMAYNSFNTLENTVPLELKNEEYPACQITHPTLPRLIITNNKCEELGSFLSFLNEEKEYKIPWNFIISGAVVGVVALGSIVYVYNHREQVCKFLSSRFCCETNQEKVGPTADSGTGTDSAQSILDRELTMCGQTPEAV